MGGYVNLAVKRHGEVKTAISSTGTLFQFGDPALYLGDTTVLERLISKCDDCPEVTNPLARGTVPFYYGLVVIDFDSNTVLDMQSGRNLRASALSEYHTIELKLNAGRLGWLEKHVFDNLSGRILVEIPSTTYDSRAELVAFCRSSLQRFDSLEDWVYPTFLLSPPGWNFTSYEFECSAEMQEELRARGFGFTNREAVAWATWQSEHSQAT